MQNVYEKTIINKKSVLYNCNICCCVQLSGCHMKRGRNFSHLNHLFTLKAFYQVSGQLQQYFVRLFSVFPTNSKKWEELLQNWPGLLLWGHYALWYVYSQSQTSVAVIVWDCCHGRIFSHIHTTADNCCWKINLWISGMFLSNSSFSIQQSIRYI